jgi:hypothetical protein
MTSLRVFHAISAALTVGLALTVVPSAIAQVGPGLSSGSGEGTGSGYSSGVQTNRSGSASGVGPGPATGSSGGMGTIPWQRRRDRRFLPWQFSVPAGPGVDTHFPDDTSLFPFALDLEGGAKTPANSAKIEPAELAAAMKIADPGDRTLTLQRIGHVAVFTNQLPLAHKALSEAVETVFDISDPTVRDLRLMAIIYTLDNLSEAHLREGKLDMTAPDLQEDPVAAPLPKQTAPNLNVLIDRAEIEWRRGAYLASRINDPTYRSEMLYRVVDNEAFGSQTIINEFPREESLHSPNARAGQGDKNGSKSITSRADRLLVKAAGVARSIERPVWRDRALVSVAYAASASKQFARGLEIARTIPQPEVRSDALVKIAESQARLKPQPDPGATQTYREAAEAVASIPLEDPRAVLTGVLIDNLISVGRFDDARATVSLYPDNARRLIALGAIAESQGFRGAADSAVSWITREMPAEYRPSLYRRVRFGVLTAIEQNRGQDLSNRER